MHKLQLGALIFIITLSFACGNGQKADTNKDTAVTQATAQPQADEKIVFYFLAIV